MRWWGWVLLSGGAIAYLIPSTLVFLMAWESHPWWKAAGYGLLWWQSFLGRGWK